MDKAFPYKLIQRSTFPYRFEKNLRTLDVFYEFNGKRGKISDLLEQTGTTGILIIKDDVIVYEKYFQDNLKTDQNTSWSMAKTFISALIGMSIQDGYIDSSNDPITKYVPELAQSGYNNVPIKHILQMSSGVKFSEDPEDRHSDINNLFPTLFIYMKPVENIVLNFQSERASGEHFNYISLDAQVLELLLRRVTRKDISTYFEERLWQPIGAESDAFWLTDNHGTELTFCCFNATLRDYAKFGMLYLNGGYFNGQQILPEAWVKESVVPDSPHLMVGVTGKEYDDWGYQYQWWIPTGSDGDYTATGVWGQFIYINPSANMVIVRTSVGKGAEDVENDDEIIALFRAIAREIK